MIVTMTGKPCSGKSVVIEFLAHKYGFEVFSSGAIYRQVATERGMDVKELNLLNDYSVDRLVDQRVKEEGLRRKDDEVIFDSRIAWFFLPDSFKTFLDVEEEEQARRLRGSNRKDEKTNISQAQAKNDLLLRWNAENKRYQELYHIDNLNPKNYDLVLDTTNISVEEGGEKVYENYCAFKDTSKQKRLQEAVENMLLKNEKQQEKTKDDFKF